MQGKIISQAFTKYVAHLKSVPKAEKTVDNYRRRLSKFISWLGDKEFCLGSVDEYRIYLQSRIKISTIHLELRVIRAFVTYLHKRKYFAENWGKNIELPKLKKKVEFIPTKEQAVNAILLGTKPGEGDNKKTLEHKMIARNALTFIVMTGIRQVELQRLKVEHIDLPNNEFMVISKGGDEEKLPFRTIMDEMLTKTLSKRKPGERVFPCTKKHLNKCLKVGCKRLGINKITVHKLRKVFGTDLARKNVNPFLIARLLRHNNVEITFKNYIRNNIEDLKLTVNSTQGNGEFMTPEEVKELLMIQIEASNLKSAKFLTISESGEEFTLTIKKT